MYCFTLFTDKYFLKVGGSREELPALKTRASKQLSIEDEKPWTIYQLNDQRTRDTESLQNRYNMEEQTGKD